MFLYHFLALLYRIPHLISQIPGENLREIYDLATIVPCLVQGSFYQKTARMVGYPLAAYWPCLRKSAVC